MLHEDRGHSGQAEPSGRPVFRRLSRRYAIVAVSALLLPLPTPAQSDPPPSWNNGAAKKSNHGFSREGDDTGSLTRLGTKPGRRAGPWST